MDTFIQLSIREILTIFGDVAEYLHEQIKKHRIPLENPFSISTSTSEIAIYIISMNNLVSSINIHSIDFKFYYALPFDRAKVIIDDQFSVFITLDNDFEINMIS